LSEGNDARALYGAVAVAGALAKKGGAQRQGDDATSASAELPLLAAQRLVQLYEAKAPDKLPLVRAALQKLQARK
jgi:hypothetical protein